MSDLGRAKRIFDEALGKPEAERDAFVRAACAGDESLLAIVSGLLAAHFASDSTLLTRDLRDAERLAECKTVSDANHACKGGLIGAYRLLSLIGEGGFGEVWLAERREPFVQRVAIKIIKPGMDTREVIARFEQERQALAVMDHPNIAKVLDGGVTPPEMGTRPYFVMEHVKGEPITEFCDRHRLTIRERLELFIPVCEAVQHAHMKGIIHRDIKPSNVLASILDSSSEREEGGGRARGSPHGAGAAGQAAGAIVKVIDFGIAKAVSHAMTEKTIFTEQGRMIGTPAYMSPEQAEMGATDIDTRTDVYSLGVVLYELLSGLPPFENRTLRAAGLDEMRRIIREIEPPKPSTRVSSLPIPDGAGREEGTPLSSPASSPGTNSSLIAHRRQTERGALIRELRRELEWVPLKAMRKDRRERYRSPADLADDVRRFLRGEALEAGPESVGYRVRKFVKRRKGPVAAAAAVVMALIAGLTTTMWKAGEARREAASARAAEADAKTERHAADEARIAEVKVREAAEYQSYVANVQLAGLAMALRQFDRARARLDACPARLRGWEWRWLDASSDNSLLIFGGQSEPVNGVAFSADGARIITRSPGGEVRVWDAATGALACESKHLTYGEFRRSLSPDGTRIITVSDGNKVQVHHIVTGALVAEFQVPSQNFIYRWWSPDSTRVVTGGSDGAAHIWDATTGAMLTELKGHTDRISAVSFSSDGKRIVTGSMDKTARVWDTATGASVVALQGHPEGIETVAYSTNGARILTHSLDGTVCVWDPVDGMRFVEIKTAVPSYIAPALSSDGARVVTDGSKTSARIWDATTGESLTDLTGHTGIVFSVAFSPDGTRIVTGSADMTARVWDTVTGRCKGELRGHTEAVMGASFNANGTLVVTPSLDGSARVWDADTSESAIKLREDETIFPTAGVICPACTRIATATMKRTRVFDAATGLPVAELVGHTDRVWSVTFSSDGTRIGTASQDKTARVWDAETGVCIATLKGHTDRVGSCAFSRDGARMVTGSDDNTARVWNVATGAVVTELHGHAKRVTSAAFSPDGTRIVTASWDKTARIWDAATGASVGNLMLDEIARSAAFSPAGSRIVTVSGDRTVCVWDWMTGVRIAKFSVGIEGVESAMFSPDGLRIVTASSDGPVGLWDAATGASLAELRGHSTSVLSVVFGPDGARIMTTARDRTVRIWDSVPYRDRYPAIVRFRAAKAKMAPRVASLLETGKSADAVAAELAADASLTADERTAWQAALLEARAARRAPSARENGKP